MVTRSADPTPAPRPRRSLLYMPGSNSRALEKARSLAADGLILDLEDAVAPEAKDAARADVVAAVGAGGFGPREVIVRVNAAATPWGRDDLAAAVAAGPDGIAFPKVSSAEELAGLLTAVAGLDGAGRTRVWAMIETPLAILDIRAIAAVAGSAGGRLAGLILGTNDLAKETGTAIVPGRLPMLPWLMTAVAAARAFGLAVIDGVFNGLDDEDGFAAECRAARDMGFDGKTLIHPKQIGPANAAFRPAAADVALALRVVEAFALPENAGKGALRVDGRMVERLHADMARRLIALDAAIAARERESAA